jgi:peptidoglycan/LPS O-acetylase OafA/YrhL
LRSGFCSSASSATTLLIGASGLAALPAAILFDRRLHTRLAAADVGAIVCGLALACAGIWSNDAPDELGKATATAWVFALAGAQTAALTARLAGGDPRSVRRLFAASTVLAFVVAAMATAGMWGEIERAPYFRVLGALVVADVLTVALQPILARGARVSTVYRLRLLADPGGKREVEVAAPTFAAAVARAVADAERDGGRILRIERDGADGNGPRQPSSASISSS